MLMRKWSCTFRVRASVAAVLLASYSPRLLGQCPNGSPPPCGAVTPRPTTTAYSVAVLSFQTRSLDTANVFLAEGLADDIASRLGQLDRLTVRSREAVRRLRNADSMSIRQLGQTLNAAYVLSGTMRPSSGRLHFVFELTRTQTGGVSWSGVFDRERDQLLELQAAVAEAAARAILRDLSQRERSALGVSSAHSERAFVHIARGTAFLARRGQLLWPAVQEFRTAVSSDQLSAVAWSRLGVAYAMCVFWGGCPAPGDSLRAGARAAADRALVLDSTLADAWLADGLSRSVSPVTRPDFPRGIASLRRARALEPRNVEVVHLTGTLLLFSGLDDEEAIRSARAALALDPGRGISYLVLSRIAFAQGRYRDAVALLDTAEALEPGWERGSDRWDAVLALGDTTQIPRACAGLASATQANRPDPTERRVVSAQCRWIGTGFLALTAGDSSRANAAADSLAASGDPDLWSAALLLRLGRRAEAGAIVRAIGTPQLGHLRRVRSPAFAQLEELKEFRDFQDAARRLVTTSSK